MNGINARMRRLLEDVDARSSADGWSPLSRPEDGADLERWSGWQHAHHGATWKSAYTRGYVERLKADKTIGSWTGRVTVAVRLTDRGRTVLRGAS